MHVCINTLFIFDRKNSQEREQLYYRDFSVRKSLGIPHTTLLIIRLFACLFNAKST